MHNLRALLSALLFSGLCLTASAQKISCDSLQQIIKIAASDSTFSSIKGSLIKSNTIKTLIRHTAALSLWQDPDDLYEETIDYNTIDHSYRYTAIADEDSPVNEILGALKSCLGDKWVVKTEAKDADDTVSYFKNITNYVVVRVEALIGLATVEIYNDRAHAAPECVTGDCKGDAGTIHYFSEDTYGGTFINGTLSGFGQITWYAQGVSYYGSLIDGHIAGFGTLYDRNGKVTKKGFFFNGDTVHVAYYKSGCQFGDCDNGFGLKYMDIGNNIYVGNFKNGLPDGYGESIFGHGQTQSVFFGMYKNGHDDGPGVYVYQGGSFHFGNFRDGVIHGKYTLYMPDKTIKAGDTETKLASYYSSNNILIRSERGDLGTPGFGELKDPAYLEAKSAAKSLDAFYHQRETDYKDIIGEQSPLIKKLALSGGYKSKLLFEGKYNATIDIDHNDYYYINIPLSVTTTPRAQWGVIYNKYYNILHSVLGKRWQITSDTGKAGAGKHSGSLLVENTFDHSEQIILTLNDSGVKMELH